MFSGVRALVLNSGNLPQARAQIVKNLFCSNGGACLDEAQDLNSEDVILTSQEVDQEEVEKVFKKCKNLISVDWISDSVKHKQLQNKEDYLVVPKENEFGPDSVEHKSTLESDEESETFPTSFQYDLMECQRETPLQSEHNQDLLDELEKIAKCRYLSGESRSHQSYRKAISILKAYPKRIRSGSEAGKLRGVGGKISCLIDEFLRTGRIESAGRMLNDEKLRTLDEFCKVHGVGPLTANKWHDCGLKSIEEVKASAKIHLTKAQQLGIKYFEDFNHPMSREEVEHVAKCVQDCVEKAFPPNTDCKLILTGGYLRGKTVNNDVDIIIHCNEPDGKLRILLEQLQREKLLSDIISIHAFEERKSTSKRRKSDDEDQFDKVPKGQDG